MRCRCCSRLRPVITSTRSGHCAATFASRVQLNLPPEERLKMATAALKIAERADERRLVLGVLTRCPSPAAIDLARTLLDDTAIRPQAAETIVIIAERIKDQDPAAASSAAQQALAAGLADGFTQRAQALVKTN